MISMRLNEGDKENLELIKGYLAHNRPDLPEPKTSQAIRYALYTAAIGINKEVQDYYEEQEANTE